MVDGQDPVGTVALSQPPRQFEARWYYTPDKTLWVSVDDLINELKMLGVDQMQTMGTIEMMMLLVTSLEMSRDGALNLIAENMKKEKTQ